MNFETLIGDSIFFIYLFTAISVISFERFSTKEIISIIYIFTYGISFNSQLDKKILLVCMIFTLFIYEEYLTTSETEKKDFFYRIIYKVIDFLYLYVCRYKILIVCVAIGLRSYTFNRFVQRVFPESVHLFVAEHETLVMTVPSAVMLCLAVHWMLTDYVQMNTFKWVFSKIKKYPYYKCPFSDPEKKEQFCRRMELIADIEDRTFFMRTKSYHFWSYENAKALWKTKKKNIVVSRQPDNSNRLKCLFATFKRSVQRIWHALPNGLNQRCKGACRVLNFMEWFFRSTKNIVKRLICTFKLIVNNVIYVWVYLYSRCKIIGKKVFRYLSRGHSTIEMQTIRILFYKRGLLLGNPIVRNEKKRIRICKSVYKIRCMIERKIFEVIYSGMVFKSLKHYLGINQITNLDYFRYYIVYLYLHVVQTNVNGKKYRPASEYFEEADVSEWSMEKIFVAGLGLCSRAITPQRIQRYDSIVKKYNLSIDEIYRLCDWDK